MVIALAGRRIDAPNAPQPRFPAKNAPVVAKRIRELFEQEKATALVCAAACGADIVALEAAGELGIRRRIVLPFSREQFRSMSVADRGGDWGERFDHLLDEVEPRGDVVVLDRARDDPKAYTGAGLAILDQADDIARELHQPVLAAVVWDGHARGERDVTHHFLQEAGSRRIQVIEISTLTL